MLHVLDDIFFLVWTEDFHCILTFWCVDIGYWCVPLFSLFKLGYHFELAFTHLRPNLKNRDIPFLFFYIAGLYVTLNLNSIPDKTLKNTMSVTRTFHCSTFSSWVITLNFYYFSFFFYRFCPKRPENGFYKFKQKWKAKL